MASVAAAPARVPATPLGRVTEPARLERVALQHSLSALDVLRAVRGEPGAFALTGSWAGGGAIVGCGPLLQAPVDADPFEVVSSVPGLDRSDDIPATAVGGGWFGWFGYRPGRRLARLPAG